MLGVPKRPRLLTSLQTFLYLLFYGSVTTNHRRTGNRHDTRSINRDLDRRRTLVLRRVCTSRRYRRGRRTLATSKRRRKQCSFADYLRRRHRRRRRTAGNYNMSLPTRRLHADNSRPNVLRRRLRRHAKVRTRSRKRRRNGKSRRNRARTSRLTRRIPLFYTMRMARR